MKTRIVSLYLAAALVGGSYAQEQQPHEAQDPILAAMQQVSSVQPNPPPSIEEIQAAAISTTEAKAAEVVASTPIVAAEPVPTIPGGSNQVFTQQHPDAAPGSIVGRLAPGLASDTALDALTRERARIRLIGDYEAQFRGAATGDVVRALAEHAQMRYIAPSGESLSAPVSISGTYNLLDLLDVLQEHYAVSMMYDRGIWRFGKASPGSLIMKTYKLKNNNREDVEITSPTINSIGSAGGVNNGSSAQTGSQSSGSTSNASFKVGYDSLTKDIEGLLSTEIPSTNGLAEAASAGSGKVIFIPETNELMVLASGYHHELVKDYITHIDQPIDQIKFAAYFVQTSDAPSRDLGIDWGDGPRINVGVEGNMGENPEILNKFQIPTAGILTQYQFAAALNYSASDSKGSVFQQPTVVGMPNRKTVLDATQQVPVAQSSFNTGSSNSATSTSSSIQYIDIGTIVNIYPTVRRAEDGSRIIRLNVSLVVSSLDGYTEINGNPTPTTNRRRFEFTAEVPEGKTLAIGGLVSSTSTRTSNKVPFLGDLPFAGRLFRTDGDAAKRSNMVVYITPSVMTPEKSGSINQLSRVWPEDESFTRPVFNIDKASLTNVRLSLSGLSREIDAVEAFIDQRRDPETINNRLQSLRVELDDMSNYIKSLRKDGMTVDATISREIEALASRASGLRRTMIAGLHL